MARNQLMYQREQSQPGGRGGTQQSEAWVGIGKANARRCFGYGRATVATMQMQTTQIHAIF